METVFVGPAPRLARLGRGRGHRWFSSCTASAATAAHWDAQVEYFSRAASRPPPGTRAAMASPRTTRGRSSSHRLRRGPGARARAFRRAKKRMWSGLSMGGRIARNFALQHPERVQSLALANTSPGLRRAVARRGRSASSTAAHARRRRCRRKRLLGPDAPRRSVRPAGAEHARRAPRVLPEDGGGIGGAGPRRADRADRARRRW